MVKNKTGGNRHKKQARKNVNAPVSTKLRFAKEEGEMYAKVTKLFGNGMAEILCNDKETRLLIIRRRFKGRNKRDNMIELETFVLVGIRTWEVRMGNKKQKADLLYVYSPSQVEELIKKDTAINEAIVPADIVKEVDDGFEFSTKEDTPSKDEDTILGDNLFTSSKEANKSNKKTDNEPDFDWDDI